MSRKIARFHRRETTSCCHRFRLCQTEKVDESTPRISKATSVELLYEHKFELQHEVLAQKLTSIHRLDTLSTTITMRHQSVVVSHETAGFFCRVEEQGQQARCEHDQVCDRRCFWSIGRGCWRLCRHALARSAASPNHPRAH